MSGDGLTFVAGEPSGDTHAAHVLEELQRLSPGLRVRGLGGPKMQAAGMALEADLATDAVMGIFPVIKALPRLRRLFAATLRSLETDPPKALVLVDYPGFNLRLAARAKALGVPVIYYISPQVWAWAKGRIAKIVRMVDLMLVILPFEAEVYREVGLKTVFVGHPLLEHLKSHALDHSIVSRLRSNSGGPLVGIFPGSRAHVVKSLLPVFLDAAERLRSLDGIPSARFALALAQRAHEDIAAPHLARHRNLAIAVITSKPYEVMHAADLCLATSGTTTLEIAAHAKPFVIGYRVSPILYALGRMLIRVPHIGLVNLVANRSLVPEHVGVRNFAAPLAKDLAALWKNEALRQTQVEGLRGVRRALETDGSYTKTAQAILEFIARR